MIVPLLEVVGQIFLCLSCLIMLKRIEKLEEKCSKLEVKIDEIGVD